MNQLTDLEVIASTVLARRNGVFRKEYLAIRTGFVLLWMCFAASASAKIGETLPQLVKRFGKSYAIESDALGERYSFRSKNVSVDVFVSKGVSVAETYFSDHPLTASGEPPNDVVRAVLKTNEPRSRWIEMDAAPFGADYALQSSNHEYIALLRYKGSQPEGVVWTMTVGREKVRRSIATTARSPSSPVTTPAEDWDQFPPVTTREDVKSLRRAAEQGDPGAQNNLGFACLNGQGVPKNYVEAVKWFRKSRRAE